MRNKSSNYNIVKQSEKNNTRNFICGVFAFLFSAGASSVKYTSSIMRRLNNTLKLNLSMFMYYTISFRLSLKKNTAQILTR